MLQSIFNLDSFPLFFLVAGVGLVWGLNEGRKYFTQATPAMQDASNQTTCSEFKDYKNEEVQATPAMNDVPTQTTIIAHATCDNYANGRDISTSSTSTHSGAYTQTDVVGVDVKDAEIVVNKLSYYYTKADKDCAVIYSEYLNRLPSHPDWRTKLGLMYGNDLIAYVESREQSLASTLPVNAGEKGIPNSQLQSVVEEVFDTDIVQEGIIKRWSRRVASAFFDSTASVPGGISESSLGRDSMVGVEDSTSNVGSSVTSTAPSQHSQYVSEGSTASTAPLIIPNAEMVRGGMPLPVPNAEMAIVRGTSVPGSTPANVALSTWDSIVNSFLS